MIRKAGIYVQGLTVHFHDLSVPYSNSSSGAFTTIVGWRWDFGDFASDSFSSERNPIYNYAARGNYTVSLAVTDNLGSSGETNHRVSVGHSKSSPNAPILRPSPVWGILICLAVAAGFTIAGVAAKSGSVRMIFFLCALVVFFIFIALFPRELLSRLL